MASFGSMKQRGIAVRSPLDLALGGGRLKPRYVSCQTEKPQPSRVLRRRRAEAPKTEEVGGSRAEGVRQHVERPMTPRSEGLKARQPAAEPSSRWIKSSSFSSRRP